MLQLQTLVQITDRMQRYLDWESEQLRLQRPNAIPRLMESTVSNQDTEPFLSTINGSNSKGGDLVDSQDEYERYNPEPMADKIRGTIDISIYYVSSTNLRPRTSKWLSEVQKSDHLYK